MKIIACCSSIDLTHAVCRILGTEPIFPTHKRFSDGEISVDISSDDIQDDKCLLIHSLSDPVNDNMVTLLLTIDALKRGGANKIIVCLPYLAYTRQTHATSLIASLMHSAGVHQGITVDPHSHIENTAIPIDVLSTTQLFADHIKATYNLCDFVIVMPDQGSIERCKHVHGVLGLRSDLIRIDKVRADAVCTVQAIHGDVRGKRCIIVDDIINTGTTLCSAADALIKHGAAEVFAYCTHGVLSGDALVLVQKSLIKKLVITDTIEPQVKCVNMPKIKVISVAGLLAEHMNQLLMNKNHSA